MLPVFFLHFWSLISDTICIEREGGRGRERERVCVCGTAREEMHGLPDQSVVRWEKKVTGTVHSRMFNFLGCCLW